MSCNNSCVSELFIFELLYTYVGHPIGCIHTHTYTHTHMHAHTLVLIGHNIYCMSHWTGYCYFCIKGLWISLSVRYSHTDCQSASVLSKIKYNAHPIYRGHSVQITCQFFSHSGITVLQHNRSSITWSGTLSLPVDQLYPYVACATIMAPCVHIYIYLYHVSHF